VSSVSAKVVSPHHEKELELLHRHNLIRREHGAAPLRWNRQLSEAATVMSLDRVQHTFPECNHQDSQGRGPSRRISESGYMPTNGWGENVVCGFTLPENAMNGWMNSPGHRANILHPLYREIGVSYAGESGPNKGFITADFGLDERYAPVIINDEAPTTTSSDVNLYIYNLVARGTIFDSYSAETREMMISNSPTFEGAVWQDFQPEVAWTLDSGEGLKFVYVRLRDAAGRIATAHDSIHVGESFDPTSMPRENHASTLSDALSFQSVDIGRFPRFQLSLSWIADNSATTFDPLGGYPPEQIHVADANAVGGTVARIQGGAGMLLWAPGNSVPLIPLVAYVRLRATDASQGAKVHITMRNGTQSEEKSVTLPKGQADFMETPFYFSYTPAEASPYVIFDLRVSAGADVDFDAVRFFTQDLVPQSPFVWPVPGGYYRGRGVQIRLSDGRGRVSEPYDVSTFVETLTAPISGECGDSVVQLLENCDDGNTRDGDGCSALCLMEHTFYLTFISNP